MIRQGILIALCCFAGLAQAQPYRWVDDKGRVQFTDTPPPAGAKDVRKENIPASSAGPAEALPYSVARARKDFPVTFYSSPTCKETCDQARALFNKRGIPFTEVQVWDEASQAKLKAVAGSAEEVPVLTVGRSVQKGFEPGAYNSLLDSAGYPQAGFAPARSQSAPPPPEGSPEAKAAAKPAAAEPAPKAGPYDTSGLKGTPQKPGQYSLPGDAK